MHTPRRIVLLVMLVFAAVCAPRGADARGTHEFDRIEHIVVIDLENHSFDNLYGEFPGADGFASARRLLPQVDERGRPYVTLPVKEGSPIPPGLPNRPFSLEEYCALHAKLPDLSHAFDDEKFQMHGGRMDRFVLGNSTRAAALGYYHTMDLPLAQLAREYTLCDRYFHSAIGGSFLSHIWLVAAASPRFEAAPASVTLRHGPDGRVTHGGFVTEDGFAVNTCQPFARPHGAWAADSVRVPPLDMVTIGERLSEAGVSWAWYAGGWDDAVAGRPDSTFQFHHQPFVFMRRYAEGTAARSEHLKDEADFVRAARDGTLPAVSFVKPIGAFNEHPGYADLLSGERHTVELIRAVQAGPQWASTVIIVTYDEHGGFWDHVAPPVLDEWGPGTRVPTIVIAPFARRGHVDHTTYETVSILALIEQRWHLAPLTRRDARANPLRGAFDFRPVRGPAR